MISSLSGKLTEKNPPRLVLDVGGVGYELEVPMPTFVALPDVGAEVHLHTHLVVRENAHLLYGFTDRADRNLFRLLITISGVGPKLALMILSGMSVAEFQRCVAEQEVDLLVQLPGVGRKTAERVLIEVRDRLPGVLLPTSDSDTTPSSAGVRLEAQKALETLGYNTSQSKRLVQDSWQEGMRVEEVIMVALKRLS